MRDCANIQGCAQSCRDGIYLRNMVYHNGTKQTNINMALSVATSVFVPSFGLALLLQLILWLQTTS